MAEAAKSEDAGKATQPIVDKPRGAVNVKVIVIGVVFVILVAAAVYFSFRFVEDERQRELTSWQVRLGIVADSRTAAVNEWFDQSFATLRELTQNASLQLYMTELALSEGDRAQVTDEAAQATYLRNLLVATAERTGFKPPAAAGEVAANVEKAAVAGLGLTDAAGRPIVSTPGMPPISGKVRTAVNKALTGEPAIIDIYMGATNLPTIGFALPIYGLQDDEGSQGIGAVVGIRVVGKDLYERLKQPGETAGSAETYLVRLTGGTVEYLSPLADGTAPLGRTLAVDPGLDAAFALEKPGGFAIKRDYTGEEVLVTARAVANVPWVLVRKVSRAEALAASETRLRTMLIVFVLIIVGVAVAIIAVWRHGTSVRMTEAAEKFRISSERFENISKFMRLVTDSQPNSIVAVDGTTTYTFANLPAAREGGVEPQDMMGKTMASVIGPVKAKTYAEINKEVLSEFARYEEEKLPDSRDKARQSHLHEFRGDSEDELDVEVVKSDHIPLRGDRDHPPGVLMVLTDITELTREKRRSERMLRQLIDTLVSVVDRRDPYSANHSTWTAEVAQCVAEEMGLPETDVKVVDIAGSLASVGKIFVPVDLLGKGEADMTPAEHRLVATSHLVSADLLQGVTFDGPVVETIRQSGERWDGGGPLGLKGESILPTARILAVATMFVRKVSARSYREGMTFDAVSDLLIRETGTVFDRKTVTALINFLENRGGTEKWAHFRERPAAA